MIFCNKNWGKQSSALIAGQAVNMGTGSNQVLSVVAAQFYYSHSSKIANQRPLFGIWPAQSSVQKLSMSTDKCISKTFHICYNLQQAQMSKNCTQLTILSTILEFQLSRISLIWPDTILTKCQNVNSTHCSLLCCWQKKMHH